MQKRLIAGLTATVLVLTYTAVLKPLSRPSYADAPTCWVEKDNQVYCGDAGQINRNFKRWIPVQPIEKGIPRANP